MATVLGKNTFKYKAQAFTLGSSMAGLSGSLFSQYMGFIDPTMFEATVTFSVWMMVILGGPSSSLGAILGAFTVEGFRTGANIVKDYVALPIDPINFQNILIGLLIILVLFHRPQGLLKEGRIKTPARSVLKHRLKTS